MNRDYTKGINAAGLLLLAVQYLVLLYKYIVVGNADLGRILIETWAAVCGSAILVVMFVRKFNHGLDIILTVIGVMLWGFQLYCVFGKYPNDKLRAFIVSCTGIFGLLLIVLSLAIDIRVERKRKAKIESGDYTAQ